MRKIVCKGMVLLLLAGFLSAAVPPKLTVEAANTSGTFDERVNQLKKKFPNGKYWNHEGNPRNNPDGYTSRPCSDHSNCDRNGTDYSGSCGCNSFNGMAIQCMGFAEKLGYDVFGTNPRTQWTKSYNLANIKAGDIVRYKTHSIFVTKVSGNTITYADCNSDGHCRIRWDAVIQRAALTNLVYIQHANNYSSVKNKKSISGCTVSGIKSSYAYTGRAIVPSVTVADGGKILTNGTDYVITYKNNVNTGKASVKIEGRGSYGGSMTKTFRIVPKRGVLRSVSKISSGRIRVKWKKDMQASGYEILLSTNSGFKKGNRTVRVGRNSADSWRVNNLKPGKRYYVKIRSYKLIDGKKRCGSYSSVKKISL